MKRFLIRRSVALSLALGLSTGSAGFAATVTSAVHRFDVGEIHASVDQTAAIQPCYDDCDSDNSTMPPEEPSDVPPCDPSDDDGANDSSERAKSSNMRRIKSTSSRSAGGRFGKMQLCCHRNVCVMPMQTPARPSRPAPAPRPAPPAYAVPPASAYSAPVYRAQPAYAAPAPAAPSVYSAPAPVTYAAPAPVAYAAPEPAPAPAPAAMPAAYVAPPAPPAPAAPVGDVVLSNMEQGAIAYTLNGTRYDMNPGYSQKLTNRSSWTVEFDRGNGQGTARYTLTKGSYQFVATERGWDLFKQNDEPAQPAPIPGFPNVARN